jgi:hypothetical protein
MHKEDNWYPMRWQCGPLEEALRRRRSPPSSDSNASLMRWSEPESLDLLRGTPINCLVVPWAAGLAEDQEQQQRLSQLLSRGRTLGLHFVGRLEPPADPKAAAALAYSAGLSAIALESVSDTALALPVVQWSQRQKINWSASSPVVALTDCIWPGIRGNVGNGGDTAIAGPTGMPWLDSNAWLIQLARARDDKKNVWLAFDPPKTGSALPAESYLLALADTEGCGARWVVSLDDHFRVALTQQKADALERWKQIGVALSFFQSRRGWNVFRPKAALGLVSTDTSAHAFMEGEILNLLSRRLVPFRILAQSPWNLEETRDLVAVLYTDANPPSAGMLQSLVGFAERGGLLIVPNTWEQPAAAAISHDLKEQYALYRVGLGKLAIARETWQDPYPLAEEAHLLMSRRSDVFRLGNGASMSVYCASSADGKTMLIHLTNFDRRGSRVPVSLWVKQPFRTARLWKLGSSEPVALPARPEHGGRELALPPFTTYAAVELES